MKNSHKIITLALLIGLSSTLFAEVKTAEDLLKSMKQEDITYAQLMEGMGNAANNIQRGIISMNPYLVKRGIDFIRTHPAPKDKPWVIMAQEEREAFKETLVVMDKIMDEDVAKIEKALLQKDWMTAQEASQGLDRTCISCHVTWKNNVKYIMK
ncbi:MAG: hypothetical protein J0647_00380 [Campylobacteraceae bacterium]|nr:hypothetical protein [Campylobacteraceae bacterium]